MVGIAARAKSGVEKKSDIGKASVTGKTMTTDPLHSALPVYGRLPNTAAKKISKHTISSTDSATLSKSVPKTRKQRFNVTSMQQAVPKPKKVEKKKSDEMTTESSGTIDSNVSLESETQKVEVNVPQETPHVHDEVMEDNSILKNMKDYSDKIDNLIQELGTLKEEVSLQKKRRETGDAADIYSHDSLHEQFDVVTSANEEKEKTNEKNDKLHRTLRFMETEAKDKAEDLDKLTKEKDYMKKKITDLQQDGMMAARQIYELQELIRQLQQDNISNSALNERFMDNPEDLKYKLSEFEKTNKYLREMLQQQHMQNMDNDRHSEQVETLLLKISEYENRCQRLSLEVLEKDRNINELQAHVQGQFNENSHLQDIVQSLESVKVHLQKQVQSKESELNRFERQMETVEEKLTELKMQKEANNELLYKVSEELEENEGLKKACSVYKEKAESLEERMTEVQNRLATKDARLFERQNVLSHSQSRLTQMEDQHTRISADANLVNVQIQEVEGKLKTAQTVAQKQILELVTQIDSKNTNIATLETDLEQLKAELEALKKTIEEYESMLPEYKSEMERCRQEAEVTVAQLEHEQVHNSKLKEESTMELQQLKDRLQTRLQELEPLPGLLEEAEAKLQDTSTKLSAYEQRNYENTNLISELTIKVEAQYDELMNTHDHTRSTYDQNHSLLNRNESNERKVTELESRNRDLTLLLNERDQSIASNSSKVEALSREKMDLQLQLDNLHLDIKRQADNYREKAIQKDRTNQTITIDLEKEVVHLKTERTCLTREKDQSEQSLKKSMAELTERLEQSYTTNRNMQKYLSFLKQSYGNVFGDVLADAACCPNHLPFP